MKNLIVFMALCIGINSIVYGQTIALKDSTFHEINMDEVIVTANKFEEDKNKLPQQILSLTKKEITFQNQASSAEMLQNTGQVLVQKSQLGGGSPIIRGFEANKVLIVVDGIRMNNAIYRGGHLQNVITLDQSMFDKIEVLFGPNSVIYGSDALGGVMHFHTLKPKTSEEFKISGNAFARYSSAYQENTIHTDLNFGLKKWAFLTSVTGSNFGDLRQGNIRNPYYGEFGKRLFTVETINGVDSMVKNSNPNIQTNSGYQQLDFMQKIYWEPSKNMSHTINAQYSTSSNINRYDRLTDLSGNGNLKSAEWYYGPQKRLLGAYHISILNKKLFDQAKITLAYQSIEESRHNRNFKSSLLNHRMEYVDVASLNADFLKNINKHTLQYGIEGTYNEVVSKAQQENISDGSVSPLDTRYPDGGSAMQSAAAYLTHALNLSNKIILSEGLRVNYVGLDATFKDTSFFSFPFKEVSQSNSAISGNLGIQFFLPQQFKLTTLASSGFRVPNVDDLAKVFESTPGRLIIPNPELKPEYTYNSEISISKRFANHSFIELGTYYTWYENAISTQKATYLGQDSISYLGTSSGVYSSQNVGKAYIYGASGSLILFFTKEISLQSSLNYTYGRIKTDTTDYPLDHIPPVFGKTSLRYQHHLLQMEFFSLYNGWKSINNYNLVGEDNIQYATTVGMPAWMTLNVRGSYQAYRNIQIQASLENILDQNYRVFGSGISAAGRNLIISLRANF